MRRFGSWRRFALPAGGAALLLIAYVVVAYAWGSVGHKIINLKAVMHLPSSMSALKADSLFYQAHASDADNRKNYSDTTMFAEAGRHFLELARQAD